jgi:hypothetical protein
MKNATLIGDKGYLPKKIQLDLFHYSNVKLQTPNAVIKKKKTGGILSLENQEKELKHCFLNCVIK